GMRQVKGVAQYWAETLMAARHRPFTDVEELQKRTRMPTAQLEKLAEADCFRSCTLDRRTALWQVRGLVDAPDLPLFQHADADDRGADPKAQLPTMSLPEHVVNDYQSLRLSLKAHPLSFLRAGFNARGIIPNEQLPHLKSGRRLSVAGLVLVRQRPGSSKGVIFMTLEDETGTANIVVWNKVFEKQRAVLMGSRLLVVHGELQHEDGVIHVVAKHLEDASHALLGLSDDDAADNDSLPAYRHAGHPRNVKDLIPKGRNFH
ncbi:MAG: error-prone DNA polymerase, partial [Alphaproteobacteria bacterium]|nr:error-prone DNA polymerase [Alphaproteobacteria bacterium]